MASLTDQLKPVTSRWQHRSIACIVHGQQDGFLPAAVPRQLLALVTLHLDPRPGLSASPCEIK